TVTVICVLLALHADPSHIQAADRQTGGNWPGAATALYMTSVDPVGISYYATNMPHSSQPWTGIILDWGQPWSQAGVYGTQLYNDPTNPLDTVPRYATTAQIEVATEQFIADYTDCCGQVGGTSFVVGTSNHGSLVTSAHGSQWAQMVIDINNWMQAVGYDYHFDAATGIDAEPAWSTAAAVRSWVDAYKNVPGRLEYYDYGSCDNCPNASVTGCYYDAVAHPDCDAEVPNVQLPGLPSPWSVSDVYYIAWGATPASPFPEIYTSNTADQWEYVYLYGSARSDQEGFSIYGTLNECGAEVQTSGHTLTYTPRQGWNAMVNATNTAAFTPYTSQSVIQWSSDIAYELSSLTPLPSGTCYS
ncbi:MAG TPA: hypothetical protein VFD32_08130, partial [Dehalococcoidia bacterium]|nr:hypothetical protein [Dehalococcoidia bacterium]